MPQEIQALRELVQSQKKKLDQMEADMEEISSIYNRLEVQLTNIPIMDSRDQARIVSLMEGIKYTVGRYAKPE